MALVEDLALVEKLMLGKGYSFKLSFNFSLAVVAREFGCFIVEEQS